MTDPNRAGDGQPTPEPAIPAEPPLPGEPITTSEAGVAPQPPAVAQPGVPAESDVPAEPVPTTPVGVVGEEPSAPVHDDAPTEAFSPAEAAAVDAEPVADAELGALVTADTAETVVATDVTPPPAPLAPPAPVAAPAPVVAPPPVVATPVVAAPVAAVPARRSGLSTVRRIVAFLFGVLQALLILRIVLLLLNANQDDQIVSAILSITQPFVDPFLGMFNMDSVSGQKGSVLDIAAIVALIAWTLVETLILAILRLFDRRAR